MAVLVADGYGRVQSTYEAASHNLPDLAHWFSSSGSADADLLPNLQALRNRSRDLERNSGIAL